MINEEAARNYAIAIYEIAEQLKKEKVILENLKIVAELYEKNIEFRDTVNHPSLPNTARKVMVVKVFADVLDSLAMDVMTYLIEKDRFNEIAGISREFQKMYNEKNAIIEVEAVFAVEPTGVQKDELNKKLAGMTGKKIELIVKIDKSIIGGGIIKIGDRIIDGSIRRQFEILRASL